MLQATAGKGQKLREPRMRSLESDKKTQDECKGRPTTQSELRSSEELQRLERHKDGAVAAARELLTGSVSAGDGEILGVRGWTPRILR